MPVGHRHIEVFHAVMRAGSVTAAALALHTSQPTVSRELARLELLLGFALFERGRGRLRPTARGLALYAEVERAEVGLARILARAERLARFAEGQLTVACLPALAHALLPGACRRFLARHPDVGLSLEPLESPLLEEALTAQRHDLGVVEHERAPLATRLQPLLADEEVCVLPAGHALLRHARLEPAHFADQRFVSLAPGDPYRSQVDALFQHHGVRRRMALETSSAVSLCRLVQQGLGVGIVNPLTAHAFAGQGLAVRRLTIHIPFRLGIVFPEHRPATPLAQDFADALVAELPVLLAATANV
ncbi:MAG: LysR family transcriptional regulator [Pseudomonadota bacterium]|nr:LysR family transcriptional regulator [Pseudomonadota bacterium]